MLMSSEPCSCGNAIRGFVAGMAGFAGLMLTDFVDCSQRLKGLFGLIPAAWPEKPNSATVFAASHRWVPPEPQKTYFYHGLLVLEAVSDGGEHSFGTQILQGIQAHGIAAVIIKNR